ncbi:MAG: tetratricopeptide repeat protein [Phycisphaerales bacterium]|jgi:tetratricopeptide (TPR) repeat protein|nr:tetratricopeptide repeat protein [Phycisphaerales bacterium]
MAKKYKPKQKLNKRKKAKANTRLIKIIGASMVVLIIGFTGVWYATVYKSAQRNVSAGDENMAAGEFNSARKQYGKAVNKEPSNIEFVNKLQNAILSITPSTPDEATVYYRDYIGTLVHEARYKPLDIDVQLKIVEETFKSAHLTGSTDTWRQLQMLAENGLDSILPDDPRRNELVLYRGLASLRLEDTAMTDDIDLESGNIRFPGEDDIELVLEENPNSEIAWSALAHGRMAVYYRLLNEGRRQMALKSRNYFDETMQEALEVAGDSVEVSLTYLRAMLLRRNALSQVMIVNPEKVTESRLAETELAVEDARDRLIAAYNPSDHSNYVGQIAALLPSVNQDGSDLAIEVLKKHLEKYPNDVKRRYTLLELLQSTNKITEAKKQARRIIEEEQQTVGLQSTEQFRLRPYAAQILVQLCLDQIDENSTDEEYVEYINEAKESRETLSDLVSNKENNPLFLYTDGVIALSEKDYATAASKLEEVISRIQNAPSRVYREAAFALAESGARGLASERLEVALKKEPSNLANYLLKARIEMMISDYAAAKATLSLLPEESRSRSEVIELLDVITMNQGVSSSSISDPILAVINKSIDETSKQEFDTAIKTLTDSIDQTEPADWRLYAALSNVYVAMQDLETAATWVRKAIELNPDSKQLARILINLEHDDPISAVIASVETREDTEANKAEELAWLFFNISGNKASSAKRWANVGNSIESGKAQDLSNQTAELSKKYQKIAEELGADMSRILFIRTNQAITDKDYDLSEKLVEELSTVSINQQEVDGLRIRLYLSKATDAKENGENAEFESNVNNAHVLAKKMTEEFTFSDYSWTMLSAVYYAMGQQADELAANAEAYRINPKDRGNIRRYIGSLSSSNTEEQRLLQVARMSKDQFPRDKQIVEVWLEIELNYGQKKKVFEHRFNQFYKNPNDRINSLKLASLLVNTEPARNLFWNKDGTEKFSVREWSRLTNIQKQQLINSEVATWDKITQGILDSTSRESDPDVRTAFIHASVARDRGQLDEASLIWDKFIDSREDPAEYSEAVIAAAEFLQQSNRFDQAVALLERAKESQTENHEIDAALGSIFYLLGKYEESANSLQFAVDATNNPILHARLIESLANSGQFEKAESYLETYKTNNQEYGEAMLSALIHRVKSEQLLAQGNITGGVAELTLYRNALREATTADSKNPVPYIRLCRSLLNEYQLTQNKSLLEEALLVADEGSTIRGSTEQFEVVKADVFQADGQLLRAIDEMVRFISQDQSASILRLRLVEAYLDTDDVDRAISVIKNGIDVDPSEPTWYSRLGDLHIRANDERGEATKAYLSALQRDPSMRFITRIDEITRTEQVLPNLEILSMAQGPMSKMHPIVASIEAKALNNLGRRRDALLAMEKSWNMFQQGIKNGWIHESTTSHWFLDLKEMFKDDPKAGEDFVKTIINRELSLSEQAGLATYYHAFGNEYWDKTSEIIAAAIDKSIEGSDIRARLLMMRGAFLVELGRYEEGEAAFRELAKELDSPLVLNNLAYVVGVYLDQPAKGLEIAKQAAARAPRSAAIIDTVAVLYEHLGDSKKASETLEFLLQISPSNAEAMARLALIYADALNQPERAVVFAERARSQKPRSAEVLDALGWSYYRMGRIMKAEEFINRSLKQEETALGYLHLAQLVMAKSEYDEAMGHLRMAQELAKHPHSLNRIKSLQDDIRKAQAAVSE